MIESSGDSPGWEMTRYESRWFDKVRGPFKKESMSSKMGSLNTDRTIIREWRYHLLIAFDIPKRTQLI